MFDTSDHVLAFHDEEVTLRRAQRTAMRDRRNANRDRLERRLKEEKKPCPQEFIPQGSYVMLTMVQDPDDDYDIDDGIYFTEASLKHGDGTPYTPKEARQLVCDMLKDDRFNKQPKVLENCIRIYYNEGYHVDMPIYRIRTIDGQYELASGDKWIVSRAADVEEWFDDLNVTLSPDEENGRQFRRDVRQVKKFSRSRRAWTDEIAAGFTITKLVAECYVADADREDVSLRNTMQKIYDRLKTNLEVHHPVTHGAMLTKGPDDAETAFFRDKLEIALEDLKVLDDADCTESEALKAWDKTFNTDFFSKRAQKQEKAAASVLVGTNLLSQRSDPRQVDKQGGGRYA